MSLHVAGTLQSANMFRNQLSLAEIACFSPAMPAVYSALSKLKLFECIWCFSYLISFIFYVVEQIKYDVHKKNL